MADQALVETGEDGAKRIVVIAENVARRWPDLMRPGRSVLPVEDEPKPEGHVRDPAYPDPVYDIRADRVIRSFMTMPIPEAMPGGE